jgi:phosphoribosylformylglycinamidine synthase
MVVASGLGMEIDLSAFKTRIRSDYLLFSETQSRFVITVREEDKSQFEQAMQGVKLYQVGRITHAQALEIKGDSGDAVAENLSGLEEAYKETLRNY